MGGDYSNEDDSLDEDDQTALLESIGHNSILDTSDLAPRDAFWAGLRDESKQMLSTTSNPNCAQATYLQLCVDLNKRPETWMAKIWAPVDGSIQVSTFCTQQHKYCDAFYAFVLVSWQASW
jgi:hypothetical protein